MSKAHHVYNKESKTLEETIHVILCDTNVFPSVVDYDSASLWLRKTAQQLILKKNAESQKRVIENAAADTSTRDETILSPALIENSATVENVNSAEPESVPKQSKPREWRFLKDCLHEFIIALEDPSWIKAMEEELEQFEENQV
ncbi:hypothetical protein PIB30_028917 [Stylosanthes scabra]|uniref:Uncharacterized protein n=1 Tax=Stylosanthes scabra TaxID=79078 RepID=A0ABU6QB03_9FABA|nr:hypothetical protein [Stylosanthes scabra]